MNINPKLLKELALKSHEFSSELSNADALYCVTQFAMLAATGFPVVAGFTLEVPEENGIQVVFPAYEILRDVTDEDIADVEDRLRGDGFEAVYITRGKFYGNVFNGDAYRLTVVYGD